MTRRCCCCCCCCCCCSTKTLSLPFSWHLQKERREQRVVHQTSFTHKYFIRDVGNQF
jgi:hypothetical protein